MIALETLPQIELVASEPLDFTLPAVDLTPAFELALGLNEEPANEVEHGA